MKVEFIVVADVPEAVLDSYGLTNRARVTNWMSDRIEGVRGLVSARVHRMEGEDDADGD